MEKPAITRAQKDLQKAVLFAASAHVNGFRNNGCPYIIHPLQVLDLIISWNITPERYLTLCQAAVLHDVIEDAAVTLQDISRNFGEETAGYVDELTFRSKKPGEDPKAYRQEKVQNLNAFADRSLASLVVKVADRICNVRDFLSVDLKYAKKYFNLAGGLFVAFETRKEQIAKEFGSKTLVLISDDVKSLGKDLSMVFVA